MIRAGDVAERLYHDALLIVGGLITPSTLAYVESCLAALDGCVSFGFARTYDVGIVRGMIRNALTKKRPLIIDVAHTTEAVISRLNLLGGGEPVPHLAYMLAFRATYGGAARPPSTIIASFDEGVTSLGKVDSQSLAFDTVRAAIVTIDRSVPSRRPCHTVPPFLDALTPRTAVTAIAHYARWRTKQGLPPLKELVPVRGDRPLCEIAS